MEAQDIDIVAYLKHRGIQYWDTGNNISQDWIGIRCLWCGDKANHLGIHTTRGTINCFRCPVKGTVFKIIMKVERCSFDEALLTVKNFNRLRSTHSLPLPRERSFNYRSLEQQDSEINVLSQFAFDTEMLPVHENFLKSRYFDPIFLMEKYKIKFCGPLGYYKLRIIVPVFDGQRCVSFVARDATDQAESPYLNCPNEQGLIDIRDSVYNLNHATNPDVIVVEGVTDVWRVGDDCVATLGVKYTTHQVLTLSQYRRCFILFDAEDRAQDQARQLSYDLGTVVQEVIRLELPEGDPAELSESDIKSLRKQVFGKIY